MTTVLIVDDRRDAEKILNRFLTDQGFEVMSLSSAVDLIETLEVGVVDAIIMDMNMPDVDGCEATQMLRDHETLKSIPVILCTSDPIPGDEDRALASGCDLFLEKPISKDKLCEAMSKLLKSCKGDDQAIEVQASEASDVNPIDPGDEPRIAVA